MTVMKYKDFIFPHNPRKIEITAKTIAPRLHCPGLGSITQHMGPSCRVVTGQGEFFGSAATTQYAQLQSLLMDSGAGYLFLPSLTPFRAYFTRLGYLGQGDGNVISYQFEFVEQENLRQGGTYLGNADIYSLYS